MSLLGRYDHGLAPRVSPTLGSCSPVCSDTSSHRKMVGASKGYEQVVASCCLRIRKRLAGSPPEGPPKRFFSKKNFLRTHRRFPTSLPKFFGASRLFLKNSDTQIHRIFGMFRDLIIFTTGERGRIFFFQKYLEYFQIISIIILLW